MRRHRRESIDWNAASPDEELVGWAQRGEREAFGLLYDRHFGAVYGYCYRRLREREAAQDAAAETFRKALGALASCRPPSFRGWLFAIARHVIVDVVRDRRAELHLDDVVAVADPADSVEVTALMRTEIAVLITLLPRLTVEQQDVVALRLAGLTPAEIGAMLGKSRGAIDMTQHRALARLRELLSVEPSQAVGGGHG